MKPELLAPVQDFTSLKAAIDAGADAVYFGIKELNMRLGANNFTKGQIKKVIDICHKNKVNAYFTLNSIIYENETRRINHLLAILKKNKIDSAEINLTGTSRLSKILSAVYIGDWLAYLLALKQGTDPEAVVLIEDLKKKMRQSS